MGKRQTADDTYGLYKDILMIKFTTKKSVKVNSCA